MEKLYEIKNAADRKGLNQIHEFSCKILSTAGMKFFSKEMLDALEENGATIDHEKNIAFLPQKLVEDQIGRFGDEIKTGRDHLMLNGGVAYDVGEKVFAKFGAIAPHFFDWESQNIREATQEDLIQAIRLGQSVEEIGMVGCPMYIKRIDGKQIDPNFTPIINAMLLAKNTTKAGNSEVNSLKQLKYLIEMGIVIKGTLDAYKKDPVFLTAKESISPLLLDKNACEVLLGLAKNGLPATMIPMPILGAGVPITISGASALANAEILATMTAIRCVVPDAMVGGGSMASYMDMSGRGLKFNVMDAIKVDMVLSQLYEELYGLDFGYGVYASDAKKLGSELLMERVFKIFGSFLVKKINCVIGLYDQGMVFSPQLALAELEIIKAIECILKGFSMDDLDEDLLKEIKDVGHGGNFMASIHTLKNFHSTLRLDLFEEIFDMQKKDVIGSIFDRADVKYKNIINHQEHYSLSDDRSKEIDKIVSAAHLDIVGNQW